GEVVAGATHHECRGIGRCVHERALFSSRRVRGKDGDDRLMLLFVDCVMNHNTGPTRVADQVEICGRRKNGDAWWWDQRENDRLVAFDDVVVDGRHDDVRRQLPGGKGNFVRQFSVIHSVVRSATDSEIDGQI